MENSKELQPRSNLNLLLTLSIALSGGFALWLASHGETWQMVLAAMLFSLVMQTNYLLLHEGAHGNQHEKTWLNWLLSLLNGAFFPTSFTFYRISHGFHHENNRSKHECFEYYDPASSPGRKLFRYLQWYSILFGTYWILILLVNLIAATLPWLLKLWPFNIIRATQRMFDRYDNMTLIWIGGETLLIIVFWTALWTLLDLQLLPTLFCFAFFAFNWSSRQYIAHAFSPVDKETGAFNLKLGRMGQALILNSNYHLAHHQYPDLPWHLLPQQAEQPPALDYWQQYLRLWTAPIAFPDSATQR